MSSSPLFLDFSKKSLKLLSSSSESLTLFDDLPLAIDLALGDDLLLLVMSSSLSSSDDVSTDFELVLENFREPLDSVELLAPFWFLLDLHGNFAEDFPLPFPLP